MGVKVREKVKGSGDWWVFINYNRKRRSVKVGSEEAALEVARKAEAKIKSKELRLDDPDDAKRILLREYSEKWLAGHVAHNLKPATQRSYRDKIDRQIIPVFGNRYLSEISRGEIRDFCHKLMTGGLSAASVKVTLIIISSLFNHAIEDGIVSENPAGKPGRYLRIPNHKGTVEFLTHEEGAALLDSARQHLPRLYPLFLAALRTGLRQGELIGLQWGDIDWSGKFLEVRRTNYNGHISTPKSGKPRRVDMSDGLAAALADHRRAIAAEAIRKGRPMPEWVFPGERGGPIEANWLRKRFGSCLKIAGMRHVPFHALRHSYASALLGLGESLAYIRDQLGHHSIQITVDNYGHLVPGANREAVNRLDNLGKTGRNAPPAQPAGAQSSILPESKAF